MSSQTDVKPEALQRSVGIWSTKNIALIGIMGALGNVFSWLSMSLVPLVPNIPIFGLNISISFDLSHLTTFIMALYGGPLVGGLTGLIGGAVAANNFGFSQGNFVSGFAIPIGKALTGITAGLIMRALRLQTWKRHKAFIAASTILAYIPEGVFTVFIFLIMLPIALGIPSEGLDAFRNSLFYFVVAPILVKAFIEMFVMGVILTAFSANKSFISFMNGFFKSP
jgi:hypothetical protein